MNKSQLIFRMPVKMVSRHDAAIIGAQICLGEESQAAIETLVASAKGFTVDARPKVRKAAKAVLSLAELPVPKRCKDPNCPNEPKMDTRAWGIKQAYDNLRGLVEAVPALVLVKR